MKAAECYIGMRTTLPMMFDKLEKGSHKPKMMGATCIWIHPKQIYALFQYDGCGIKETVYLDDEKRWAKNTVIPVATVPPEMIRPRSPLSGNNAKVAEAIKAAKVSRSAVSKMVGRSDTYLNSRLRTHRMDDEETAYWLDVIHDTAAEKRKVVLPKEDDPNYTIKVVLAENHLSQCAASRLLGYSDSWLSDQFRKPIPVGRQRAIAESIKKCLSDRSESAQSDSVR